MSKSYMGSVDPNPFHNREQNAHNVPGKHASSSRNYRRAVKKALKNGSIKMVDSHVSS
jgi:Lhr-like helicase